MNKAARDREKQRRRTMMVRRLGGIGRGEWIRTTDLSDPNAALYQAEPRPDNHFRGLVPKVGVEPT